MGIEVMGRGMTVGYVATRSYEISLQRVFRLAAPFLRRDVPFAVREVPRTGSEADGRVG